VKFAYLVADKPAKLIVEETLASRDELAKQLAAARATFADPAARIDSLQAELLATRATADQALSRNAELAAENERYQERGEAYKYNLPWQWVLGTSIVCLLIGFLGALWFIDSRSRKRHGGIRIY
jgi:type VI protein secretion system component VasF